MIKLKPMQNSSMHLITWSYKTLRNGEQVPIFAKVETTMTKLLAYDEKGELLGKAGVKHPKDFDYDILLVAAKAKSNLSADM